MSLRGNRQGGRALHEWPHQSTEETLVPDRRITTEAAGSAQKGYNEPEEEPPMNISDLDQSRFPVVYERGQPVAVLVDLETFKRMVGVLEHLKELSHDEDEEQ